MSWLFLKWEHLSQSGAHDASPQRSEGTLGRKWVTVLDVDWRKSTHVFQKYLLSRYSMTNHKLDATDQILSINKYNTHQFSSVAQSCQILCNSMDCSTPSFPVHHRLPELTQTHVQRVTDAIRTSYHLSSASPPAINLFQSQFFTSGDQSIGVSASASVLPMNILNWFPLGWTGWISF